jgi:hypothetical protein
MAGNVAAEVAARLRIMRDKAAVAAPRAAATAGGQAGETMVKVVLNKLSHPAGTPTPSAPGQPPAKVSGFLARSIQRAPTATLGPGIATTTYGSVAIYAAVHENGPVTITVKRARVLANRDTGQVFGTQVTIPRRPFFKPATEVLVESGELTRIMTKAFLAALDL